MITIEWAYGLAGAMFAAFALLSLFDRANRRRFGNVLFWGLMAASLIGGTWIGDFGNGLLVLGLAVIGGFGLMGKGAPATTSEGERLTLAHQRGNKLFLPALVIPATALIGTLAWSYSPLGASGWIEPRRETIVFLCLGALLALVVLYLWLKPPALAPLQEGRRLIDAIGWAAVLPQMLAALGTVFAVAGVGDLIGGGVRAIVPDGNLFLAVLVFALGMALFTIIMGNAFAAFPVMIAAVGVPLLIQADHGDPAVIGAVGMLAGFCGTLLTPMAANFNVVPAALLELKDRNGVIRAQFGTAVPLFAVNVALIYLFAFR